MIYYYFKGFILTIDTDTPGRTRCALPQTALYKIIIIMVNVILQEKAWQRQVLHRRISEDRDRPARWTNRPLRHHLLLSSGTLLSLLRILF